MPTYSRTVNNVEIRIGELGMSRELVQTITVVSDGGASYIDEDTEIVAIQTAGLVPTINATYPPATIPTGMTWERYLLCRSISYSTINGGRAIRFTVIWSTMWMDDVASETLSFVLPSQTDYVARTRSTNIYRTGWTTNPSNTNASADIGGTAVSNGTQAKSEQVPQVAMRVRLTLDASADPMSNVATKMASYINKINSATFANFAIGSVICEGVSVQKTGNGMEFYELIFEFLVDDWYHLEQVCDTDEKGYPKLASGVPSVVKWKRVSRSTADFNNIFLVGGSIDTAWRDRTLDGYWA